MKVNYVQINLETALNLIENNPKRTDIFFEKRKISSPAELKNLSYNHLEIEEAINVIFYQRNVEQEQEDNESNKEPQFEAN